MQYEFNPPKGKPRTQTMFGEFGVKEMLKQQARLKLL